VVPNIIVFPISKPGVSGVHWIDLVASRRDQEKDKVVETKI
jgi:hypothetical protein